MILKRIHLIFVLLIAVFTVNNSTAQTPYGNYPITSYQSIDFKAPGQIFASTQAGDGRMYFAINTGLLRFNGNYWKKIKISEREAKINSVVTDKNGVVYFGGDAEFGYITKKKNGSDTSTILVNLQDNEFDYDRKIARVLTVRDEVYFISDSAYFSFDINSEKLSYHKYPKEVSITLSAFETYNRVILSTEFFKEDTVFNFWSLDASGMKKIPFDYKFGENYPNSGLVGLFQEKNQYLFFFESGEVWKTSNLFNQPIAKISSFVSGFNNIGRITKVERHLNSFWLASNVQGLMEFDLQGNFIRNLNIDNGLSDLNAINTSFDRSGNFWLNYNKGMDVVELSAPIRFYNKQTNFPEVLECVYSANGTRWVGSLQNVFKVNQNGGIDTVRITEGKAEIYDFITIAGQTLVVDYNGILRIQDNSDALINGLIAWKFEKDETKDNLVYVGLDERGVAQMEWDGKEWTTSYITDKIKGRVRSLCSVGDKLYYSVEGKGVAVFNKKTKEQSLLDIPYIVDKGDGFVIESFEGDVLVGCQKGLFKVVEDKLVEFIPVEGLTDDETYIHRLHNDSKGRLWLVVFQNYKKEDEKREVGYLVKENGKYVFVGDKFRGLKKSTIHSISRYNDEVWFAGPEGLYYHYLDEDTSYRSGFEVLVEELALSNDSVYFDYESILASENIEIPFNSNRIFIKLACPQYFGGIDMNEFRFKLEGDDKNWSNWSPNNEVNFSRLSHGTYTLKFQARNYYGQESDVKEISFEILPPWYFTWWAFVLYFILLVLLVIFVARLSVRRVKKQKEHLEEVVKERTSEIAEQNTVLEHQKAEIEEKSNDILDSIKYAERIQQTILPADEFMEEMFEDHFVLFRPKDIVSGDFYWAEVSNDIFLFSAIDCTGHGVPGAFVSIVGHNGLTRSIKEFGYSIPKDILDVLRDIVIEAFKGQGKSEVKDGMDVALCGIDYKNMKLHFAGAHNPCYIIRDGELHEIKADKQPIGQFEYAKEFTAHEFDLKKGDSIYVFTDGYIDQFGGEKGKKFKSKPFKKMLLELVHLPMKDQMDELDKRFDEWRGEHEQIDDVCVFGVRV